MNLSGNGDWIGELPRDQQALLELLAPLIGEYLKEIKSPVTVEAYLKELSIYPIRVDQILMGFWGIRVRTVGPKRLATIKAFYLRRRYRGRYLNRIADDLVRGLIKQGVTEVEIWAHPEVQHWLEKRYGIKPIIYVTHNPIETFKVYEE